MVRASYRGVYFSISLFPIPYSLFPIRSDAPFRTRHPAREHGVTLRGGDAARIAFPTLAGVRGVNPIPMRGPGCCARHQQAWGLTDEPRSRSVQVIESLTVVAQSVDR